MQILQNPFFVVLVSSGIVFIIMALITSKFPPKKINNIYGYRTKRSMKTKERWDFAQKVSADLMFRCGILMTFIGFVGYFISLEIITSTIIGTAILIAVTLYMASQTEKAIKEKFGDD